MTSSSRVKRMPNGTSRAAPIRCRAKRPLRCNGCASERASACYGEQDKEREPAAVVRRRAGRGAAAEIGRVADVAVVRGHGDGAGDAVVRGGDGAHGAALGEAVAVEIAGRRFAVAVGLREAVERPVAVDAEDLAAVAG